MRIDRTDSKPDPLCVRWLILLAIVVPVMCWLGVI